MRLAIIWWMIFASDWSIDELENIISGIGRHLHSGHPQIMKPSLLLPLLLIGCIPPSYAYLSIPIENLDARDLKLALLEVPLEQLEARMGPLQVEHLAFYLEGRNPLPYELEDRDGDGKVDHALIKVPVDAGGDTLVVTSPGLANPGALPSGGERFRVQLRFDRAHR